MPVISRANTLKAPEVTLRIGTRGSALALAQTTTVAEEIQQKLSRLTELVTVTTAGDRSALAGKQVDNTGEFVTAVQDSLLSGEIDIAVHSYKDLPVRPRAGLIVAATTTRADPRDALVARDGLTLDQLPTGSRIGTGSPRRMAQLRAIRPDLQVVGLRGNVDGRLGRVWAGELDGVIVACAGLARLNLLAAVTETLDPSVMLPAAAQGALAIECRSEDTDLIQLLRLLDDATTNAAVSAERALWAGLQAGCSAPVGALADLVLGETGPELLLHGSVTAVDGTASVRLSVTGPVHNAEGLGRQLAADLLAAGAADLMGSTR